MIVLGIETATTVCAAAVVREGTVAAEAERDEPYVHAEKMMRLIDEALRAADVRPQDLDGIAVSIGPGSFTGLRIGLSVAKGLAFAGGKPVVAVPTLYALAEKARMARAAGTASHILALLGARRDEAYGQLFAIRPEGCEAVEDERVVPLQRVREMIGDQQVAVTGEAAVSMLASSGLKNGGSGHPLIEVPPAVARCSAGIIGILGERLLEKGRSDNAATLEPRYVSGFRTTMRMTDSQVR